MRGRWASLLWAIVIVSVAVGGTILFNYTGPDWLSRRFMMAIGLPMMIPLISCGGFHGCDPGLWYWPTVFVLAVLMWWFLIEAARYLWRRRGYQLDGRSGSQFV